MSPDFWLIASFLALLLLGVPVAFALGLSGAIGILAGLSPDMLATLGTNTYNGVAKYPLIAIPLFILTGLVFEKSGVALRLGSAQLRPMLQAIKKNLREKRYSERQPDRLSDRDDPGLYRQAGGAPAARGSNSSTP